MSDKLAAEGGFGADAALMMIQMKLKTEEEALCAFYPHTFVHPALIIFSVSHSFLAWRPYMNWPSAMYTATEPDLSSQIVSKRRLGNWPRTENRAVSGFADLLCPFSQSNHVLSHIPWSRIASPWFFAVGCAGPITDSEPPLDMH